MPRIDHYTEQRFEFGDERPKPVPGVMQVIYQDGEPYAVDFLCPCGCGSGCFTPLVRSDRSRKEGEQRPIWDYKPGPILSPSIRYIGGCKSHFNIEEVNGVPGSVKWHTS